MHDAVIVGGGQSGLAAARALRSRGVRPVVLEAGLEPVGSWPGYYDSLTLFSPVEYSSMPGLRFPGDLDYYPHRDEVVDYLRTYADGLDVDIRTDTRVTSVETTGAGGLVVHTAGAAGMLARALAAPRIVVIVTTSPWSMPRSAANSGEISQNNSGCSSASHGSQRLMVPLR